MAKIAKRDRTLQEQPSPQERLAALIDDALACAKTARKHNHSLRGANFYADKMANLRADATVAFGRLSAKSLGDTSALAELINKVFSADGAPKDRAEAARNVHFALKTTWTNVAVDQSHLEVSGVFPLVTLNQTGRGYLVSVGRQVNGCYATGWYDACAVMMRRLLESVIIETFEACKIDGKIKDGNGDFVQLTPMINAALSEPSWNLPRDVKKQLLNLRNLGHTSAHNRYYLAKRSDIDKYAMPYRESVEAFLHLAKLL